MELSETGGKIMIGEKTSCVTALEGTNAPGFAEAAFAEYISEMFLASKTIKRRKPAQLEMARLTRQAVEALECLNQRLGCQPHADGETEANCPKKAGSQ